MARNIEITEDFLRPIYNEMRLLKPTLGYEIPIFQPGKPAVQSVKKTQLLIIVSSYLDSREPKTIAGGMWETTGTIDITLSVPERVPKMDIHQIASDFCDRLVDHYSRDFCNDEEQSYLDGIWWDTSVDELNRTEYVITLITRYFDYPLLRGVS